MAEAELADPDSVVRDINRLLLSRRNAEGWWTGQLSASALSTATAVQALRLAAERTSDPTQRARWQGLAHRGLQWLVSHQNTDGGWGDTILSISNISTTMLAHAVFVAMQPQNTTVSEPPAFREARMRSGDWVRRAGGVPAVISRYGRDRTFSVPILTHCALAGIVEWKDVIPLPFELACVPHRFYAAVRMPVVSYALPALIAIGQVIFRHQGHWNPLIRWIRRRSIAPSLRILESIQPEGGGFLEATPLTSFVCMSLIACEHLAHPVTQKCLTFIETSVQNDGSWPIDTNLTTWVTTLSINALCGNSSADSASLRTSENPIDRDRIRQWLLQQQYRDVHPYTQAAPGGWSWTDLTGGVPDADDTPGAMLALMNLRDANSDFSAAEDSALEAAAVWLLDLQNRDGGWPTFCRGWGTLPFDRSSCDLTAHAIRALRTWQTRIRSITESLRERARQAEARGIHFLIRSQRTDGTWLPLWFGHQFNHDDENPLYGTTRVLRALSLVVESTSPASARAVSWLLRNQNDDGGWSARRGLDSSAEETGLALDALADFANNPTFPGVQAAGRRGFLWLAERLADGRITKPAPIGFYFARLWYFEDLYPVIFAATGLNRWHQQTSARS